MIGRIGKGTLVLALLWPAVAAARPRDIWATPHRPPLSDRAAASRVISEPEIWPPNQGANRYRPTDAQLRAFHSAKTNFREPIVKVNPWYARVTGRTGLHHPTTDMVIQWAAWKWGIPTDWMRAITYFESLDRQRLPGDLARVSARDYLRAPTWARVAPNKVYESLGVAQIKWLPNGSVNPGTDPLRWQSTAFDVDYLGATIRYYYDGSCRWCGPHYHAGQQWLSVAAWNSPQPWGNSKGKWYIAQVQRTLANQPWKR